MNTAAMLRMRYDCWQYFSQISQEWDKCRGVLLFILLRRFYTVLFIPLFCRLRAKYMRLWKAAWLYNVDNIRQKDIKNISKSGNSLNIHNLEKYAQLRCDTVSLNIWTKWHIMFLKNGGTLYCCFEWNCFFFSRF